MALYAYMKVECEGNRIQGSADEKLTTSSGDPVDDFCRVHSISHLIKVSEDVDQFNPGGSVAQHQPIKVVTELDKAAPELFMAMLNSSMLEVTFFFFRAGVQEQPGASMGGQFQNWFNITIEGARLVGAELIKPRSTEEDTPQPPMLELYFTYQNVTWEHVLSQKIASWQWDQ